MDTVLPEFLEELVQLDKYRRVTLAKNSVTCYECDVQHYITHGDATIVTKEGKQYNVGEGDCLCIKRGISCSWSVHKPLKMRIREFYSDNYVVQSDSSSTNYNITQGETMLKCHDRFVNNDLLRFISRPQYEYSCSISSLTAVFNYLYADKIGIKTSNELSTIATGSPASEITGVGNSTIMRWFDKICQHYGLNGNCSYYLRRKDVEDWDNNSKQISKLKKDVQSNNKALIYHMKNHYNVVVGYFEHSEKPDDAYDNESSLQRWIILGEHSDFNPLPKVTQVALKSILSEDKYNLIIESVSRTPIWSRRWRSIRHDLMLKPNHCIMCFSKED